ncbi:MAG TPA: signal peptidase I [Chloroflexota bacterium]|nr:signal peptidase I [Chloroflexota bacterium]
MAELSGSLLSFELTALVRFLCGLGKSGDLLVSHGHWIGQLSVESGRLSAAAVEDEQGPAALEFMSAIMRGGDFEFSEGPPSLSPNLDAGADPLGLLERVAAAAPQAWLSLVPAPTDIPGVVPARTPDDSELALGRTAIYVLLDVDGARTVRDLAGRHGLLRALRSLVRLRELGLVSFEPHVGQVHSPLSLGQGEEGRGGEGRSPSGAGWRDRFTRGRPFAIGVELAQAAVFTGVLLLGIRSVVQNFRVEGTSMQPTFQGGQALVVNRAAYLHVERTPLAQILPTTFQGSTQYVFGGPQRGDVVIFRAPPQPDTDYIKRIIGLPGETIQITQGRVFIDGDELVEPYVDYPASYNFPGDGQPTVVPDGNYFVLGDNRPESFDSHQWGFVPVDNLIGRAWLRYWPPNELGTVEPSPPAQASSATASR